jgi:hypothetical protein
MTNLPEPRDVFRGTLSQCMSDNPESIRWVVALMALYLHVGPFSRDVIARIENMMATLEPVGVEPRAPIEQASSNFVKVMGDGEYRAALKEARDQFAPGSDRDQIWKRE